MMSRTGAYVQVQPDASAIFSVGTTEMGQGMITVLSQIVAEELGLEYEKVHMNPVDTSRVPDSGPTVASRSSTFSGRALQDACKPLRETFFVVASDLLKVEKTNLKVDKTSIVDKNNSENTITVKDVVKELWNRRLKPSSAGWDVSPETEYDNEKGQGPKPYVVYAWATNVAEVEVDVNTGGVFLTKLFAAHDVGKALNPQTLEGQIEGGSLQGAGYGRFEEIVFQDGKVLNNNLGTYIIPTTLDSPEITSIIVEDPYEDGPFGAKGIGEQPLMGVAPAVTNAIFNATGVRINEIPATPERVWEAIQEKLKEGQ
jgi:CO/xanthine dehydrogenase Mo-binding subunit